MRNNHIEFKEKYGGNVYIIFSGKRGNTKVIINDDIIEEIRKDIE